MWPLPCAVLGLTLQHAVFSSTGPPARTCGAARPPCMDLKLSKESSDSWTGTEQILLESFGLDEASDAASADAPAEPAAASPPGCHPVSFQSKRTATGPIWRLSLSPTK